jgi:hypothetical protein
MFSSIAKPAAQGAGFFARKKKAAKPEIPRLEKSRKMPRVEEGGGEPSSGSTRGKKTRPAVHQPRLEVFVTPSSAVTGSTGYASSV